ALVEVFPSVSDSRRANGIDVDGPDQLVEYLAAKLDGGFAFARPEDLAYAVEAPQAGRRPNLNVTGRDLPIEVLATLHQSPVSRTVPDLLDQVLGV
ncbi:MAG TPA: hypothetical protein VNL98_10830, partial [Gemmatimonadales bacterium]|nr:hypothetical protein [Gemmatimonadales bacterium]